MPSASGESPALISISGTQDAVSLETLLRAMVFGEGGFGEKARHILAPLLALGPTSGEAIRKHLAFPLLPPSSAALSPEPTVYCTLRG